MVTRNSIFAQPADARSLEPAGQPAVDSLHRAALVVVVLPPVAGTRHRREHPPILGQPERAASLTGHCSRHTSASMPIRGDSPARHVICKDNRFGTPYVALVHRGSPAYNLDDAAATFTAIIIALFAAYWATI